MIADLRKARLKFMASLSRVQPSVALTSSELAGG
jgi:hypothetical protein